MISVATPATDKQRLAFCLRDCLAGRSVRERIGRRTLVRG
jgi:hypothetical protein